MGYSPWGCKESDVTEQLTLLLFRRTLDLMVMSDLYFIKDPYIYSFEKSSFSPLPSLAVLPSRSWVVFTPAPTNRM